MTWNYVYSPQILLSVFTILVFIALAIYSYRRRSVPGALPFTFALLFSALWATGYVLEYLAVDPAAKTTWIKFQMAWQLPSATAVAFFLLEFAWPGRWLTRRNLALLSIVPLLIILLILTDHLHHLVWRGFVFNKTVTPLLGPIGWTTIVYGYSLTVVNFIVLAWLFMRSPQHRWAVVLIVISQIFFRAAYLLDKTQTLHSGLPLVVIGMAFGCLMYTVVLFRFHFLSPLLLARQKVIGQMREGMLVLDTEGQVVSLNPAAAAILGLAEERAHGRLLQEVLPSYPPLQDGGLSEAEISLGTGPGARVYLLGTSSLKDWRGQEAGRLLLLHDVTEQRRIQAQFLEQQRALTRLQEGEQLARELHDSLGQVLGYISIQVQAIRKRARDGDTDSLDGQLSQLAEVAQEAHKDIRESIFNLNTGPVEGWSFFAALRRHLAGYQEHCGIRAELDIAEGLTEDRFETGVTVQLLRVIQEALTNTRKHGRASRVHVSFVYEEGQARIVIDDDGCGFDPDPMKKNGEDHFGLVFMRERMEQIGGSLAIETQPGAGTRVLLCAPIRDGRKETAG